MNEPRRLIICCDGTWNTADQDHDGVPTPTNVRLFHNALAARGSDGLEQVPRYFSGVGADGRVWTRVVDGSTGRGLSANIRNAYLWLARTYREGDRLCLIGFSRGAFTVRSLVGMIRAAGLLDLRDGEGGDPSARADAVKAAFDHYRDPDGSSWPGDHEFHEGLRPGDAARRDADPGAFIEFLGVWDTVGALGVPDSLPLLNAGDDPTAYAFHDTNLADEVRVARHAMALDERRGPFVPRPWTKADDGSRLPLPNDHRVTQLWFPGVHSDVGGGYAEHGLSDVALRWMIDEAENETGIGFNPRALAQLEPNPFDVLHDSCTGVYEWMTSAPRTVPRVGADDRVHEAAVQRAEQSPVRQERYRRTAVVDVAPVECEVLARQAWSDTGLWLEPGLYDFTAEGDWTDGEVAAGPAGVDEARSWRRRGLVMGDVASAVEGWLRGRRGRASLEVPGSKRCEAAAWMELVGVVASGSIDPADVAPTSGDGGPSGHQRILIGAQAQGVRVQKAGYLYAFANDAWGFYSNNRGSVRLTVRRIGSEQGSSEVPASESATTSSPSPSRA